MKTPSFLTLSKRPANLPADAPRFWPAVEVTSFVGLVLKPVIFAFIALIWWASATFGLPIDWCVVLAVLATVGTLILSIPALVRVYWDAQLLDIEERRAKAGRAAAAMVPAMGTAPSA